MKKIIAMFLVLFILSLSAFALSSCDYFGNVNGGDNNGTGNGGSIDNNGGAAGNNGGNKGDDYVPNCSIGDHLDEDNNDYCDLCDKYVIVVIDFYVVNDLHGKFCDTDKQPGVDELGSYFKQMEEQDDNVVIMSSGDMWQGTAESNLTGGFILTEWMNAMNFVSMTIGNHEFDWGQDDIRANLEIADFPFLAINIYNNDTNTLADYCTPSIMIERGDIKIGIIGAIGDCYSSISGDMVEDVHFKVGSALTALVKAEADKLRSEGADIIVYSLHDGNESSKTGTSNLGASAFSSYYDTALSNGYVDLVFEAHTHQSYTIVDPNGVYHLQGGGENSGISHVELVVNSGNGNNKVREAGVVKSTVYSALDDDPRTEAVEQKYIDIIEYAYAPLGNVSKTMGDSEVEDYIAGLYLEKGLEKWGEEYYIVLGGGFLKTRSPYNLIAGTKTYADVLSLLPFDNRLVLCSVSGYNLKSRFINTTNSDYHNAYSQYGNSILNNISNDQTYYIVVDTYTALYAPNKLTIVDFYDNKTFARDLLAEAIKAGNLEVKHDNYQLTSIPDALKIGNNLGDGMTTTQSYYIKGTITGITNTTYGNIYIKDENGNELYIYGLYDLFGNRYGSMSDQPKVGDEIVVYSTIYKFVYGGSTTVELKNAVMIEKNP
ncbi:MAG: hypothetical protein IKW53_01985 [Clostridia bacterium]|nr:hypothetical protein [Clostridia bacterium]